MKKFFTFMLALVAAFAVNAKQVVFDFTSVDALTALGITAPANDQESTDISGQSYVLDGVTFSNEKLGSTATRIWNAKGALDLRVYNKSTLTFTSEEDITAIEFAGAAISFSEIAGKAWTGSAKSVTFTATATNKISTITLTIGEAATVWVPDTISVSEANALIAASDKNDHFVYGVVMGNPFITYANFNGHASFWMSDVVNTTDTIELYDGYGKNNAKWASLEEAKKTIHIGDTVLVYAGALQAYTNSKTGITINEITNGYYAETIGANPNAPEDTTTVTPPAAELDTITVAKALEIGGALASGAKTDVAYVIEGYVSNIVTYYDPANDYETFWMTDDKASTAKTNADGAFEVYKGNPVQKMEAGLHGHVYVTAKITNYNGNTIETSGSASVNIVEQGEVDEVIVVNVAEAIEAGKKLANGGVSEERYEITGYVSNVYTFFNPDFGNETVWITDDPNSTAASMADNAFEIYRGKPNTKAEVGLGAKVKITCKLKNYNGTVIENDGTNIPFEVLEASTFVPDTVSIEEAVEIAQALAEGAKAPKYSVVKGFIQEVVTPYDSQKNIATYKLAQFPNESEGAVQAYKATILKADKDNVVVNKYVNVTGYLMKKSGGAQVAEGAVTAFVEAPDMDTIHCSVAEAVEAGLKLPLDGKSDRIYAVTGFVTYVDVAFAEGIESFFMADNAEDVENISFWAMDAKLDKAAEEGRQVELVGRLHRYDEDKVSIDGGVARLIPGQGIENVVLTEKVQKVVVDGAIYIVRDGKMFDIRGTQVR